MGYQDREYYREEHQGGFTVRAPRSMIGRLILINVLVFAVNELLREGSGAGQRSWLETWCALHSDLWQQPWLAFQLLTYGFLHAGLNTPSGLWHILGNMFMLFMLGRDVEARYGGREFVRFYLAAIVVAGLVWLLPHLGGGPASLVGASGGVVAVVILFCLNFPHRTLLLMGILPVPAWAIGVGYVVLDALGSVGRGSDSTAYSAHLAGAAFAFLYHRGGWRFAGLGRRGAGRSGAGGGWASWWRRPRLKLHDPERRAEQLEKEADALLEKVHRQGEGSLTPKERKVLEAYSRRVRQKRQ